MIETIVQKFDQYVRFVRKWWKWLLWGALLLVLQWRLGGWTQGLVTIGCAWLGMAVYGFVGWQKKRAAVLRKYHRDLPPLFRWGSVRLPQGRLLGRTFWRARRLYVVPHVGPLVWVWWFLAEQVRFAICDWRWREACEGLNLQGNNAWKSVPRLYRKEATVDRVNVSAYGTPGSVRADVEKFLTLAPKIPGYFRFGLHECVITLADKPGDIRVQLLFSPPDMRVTGIEDVPPVADKRYYALATRRDGTPILARKDHSAMFGGQPGTGKSNEIHWIIGQFLADGDWVDVWISDAAGGAELHQYADMVGVQQGRLRVRYYATTSSETVEMLKDAAAAMKRRMQWMGCPGVLRKLEPQHVSERNPRSLIILDEQVLIQQVYKKGTDSDLGAIYASGRKALYTVIGCTQDGRAETIPASLRAIIPTRGCFGTDNPASTEVVLGPGAESKKGARCSTLNMQTEMGIMYTGAETSREMERGRAPYLTDAQVNQIAHGIVPEAFAERGKHKAQVEAIREREEYWLYRRTDTSLSWYVAHRRRPTYIGITNDWGRRRAEHAKKDWRWCEVHGRMENHWLQHGSDDTTEVIALGPIGKRAAERIEDQHIVAEDPVFNVKGKRKGLGRAVRSLFHKPLQQQPAEPVWPHQDDQAEVLQDDDDLVLR